MEQSYSSRPPSGEFEVVGATVGSVEMVGAVVVRVVVIDEDVEVGVVGAGVGPVVHF